MTESPSSDAQSDGQILIRGGRVYDHEGNIDDPSVRDILIRGSRIVSVTAPDDDLELKREIVSRAAISGEARVIEGRGKLIIPGFVNSHYHSYDVLAKGLLEDMPFDVWALHSQIPDVLVGLGIAALFLRSAVTVLRDAASVTARHRSTSNVAPSVGTWEPTPH